MTKLQEYFQSEYPGFASFIDNIIEPIFGESFHPDNDLQDMIKYPEEIYDYDKISNNHDEDFKALATESGLERLLELGTIHIQGDTRPIYVYDITVSNRRQLSRNRKGIQQLIARTLSNQSGAFMLFHYKDDAWEWRFSYKFVGKDKEDTTDSKRYTYLLGKDQVCKTAAQRFTNLLNKKGKIAFEDITEAFSVEKVSKEFFDHYRSIYADIICYVTGKRMVKSGGKWEEKQEHEPNEFIMKQFAQFADPEKSVRDYVKKLMGRLVFLQFIQKKGWLGVPMDDASWTKGDKEFIQHLFAQYEKKDNFIDDILEPLFKDINSRRTDDIAGNWSDFYLLPSGRSGGGLKIPYLNGGLFEKDAEDDTQFPLPAHFMDEMLNQFFSAYNFTIDENDPSDAEVGVDPEMLGRVFENLLEDNKDKGAFYTPKEIVQYMCRESLIAYLQTDIEDDAVKQSFRDFVTTHEVSALKPADVYKVDKKLREVKICDPAIGSGAFPMGLLKELFDCRMAIEGEEEGKTPAEIKKDIIQNSIYGVDIEKGAVDIARLRFWLSLIIDEQTPHALPNMDFKIMQGNSLLEQYKGVRLDNIYSNSGQMELAFDEETAARMLFLEHIYKYFKEDDHDKKKALLVLIDNAVKSLVKAKTLGNEEIAESIESLDLRNNTDFFLWHTWFNDVFENGGFDIVIGNPPYIQLQTDIHRKGIDNKGKEYDLKLGDLYKDCNYATFEKTGDIYCLFYEHGMNLLKKKGVLCFITSNKWMRAGYGKTARNYFAKKCNPKLLLDFTGTKIFENATVDVNILLLSKDKNIKQTKCAWLSEPECINALHTSFISKCTEIAFASSDAWTILPSDDTKIKRKIESKGMPLGNWDLVLTRGVGTGFDEAYVLNAEQKDGLLNDCSSEEELQRTMSIIHPMLRGREISKYNYSWGGLWMIYIPIHFPLQNNPGIKGASAEAESKFEELYPAVYKHLCKYKEKLSSRDKTETGIRYEWYCMQRARYEKFGKLGFTKIIYQELSQGSTFALDEDGGYMLNNSAYYIHSQEYDKYLIALLNSKLIEYAYSTYYCTRLGKTGVRWLAQNIVNLPIAMANKGIQTTIESLVDRILSAKKSNPKADTTAEEQEIDQLVYKLYNLTPEEIAIVEGKNE